jgi:hypothetical protein
LAAATTPTSQFTGLTLKANTALYYDPNGGTNGNNCSMGGAAGSTMLTNPILTARRGQRQLVCWRYYSADPSTQASLIIPNRAIDIDFNNPVFATSLLFSAPAQEGTGSFTFRSHIEKREPCSS